MTTYNTGNPIGSKDPRDLYDNAENFDDAVNNRSADYWIDRLGVSRQTWAGIERSGGIQGFATLADLQASPGQSEGQLAQVTNDQVADNNGLYRWNGVDWVYAESQPVSRFYFDREVGSINERLAGEFRRVELGDESIVYEFHPLDQPMPILIDRDGNIISEIDSEGNVLFPESDVDSVLFGRSDFLTYENTPPVLILDSEGNVIFPESDGGVNVKDIGRENVAHGEYYLASESVRKRSAQLQIETIDPFVAFSENINNLYSFYDELVNEFPDYVSRETVGLGTDDLPIYAYKFTPAPRSISTEREERFGYPKVIMVGGLHGNERHAQLNNLVFANKLCRSPYSEEEITWLRFNCNLTIIPAVNPTGIEDNTRYNRNFVDINRNFDANWSEGTGEQGGVTFNYGTHANSEPESLALSSYITNNTPIDLVLDTHNASADHYFFWVGTMSESLIPVISKAGMDSMAKLVSELRPETLPEYSWHFPGHSNGTMNRWCYEKNIAPSAVFEVNNRDAQFNNDGMKKRSLLLRVMTNIIYQTAIYTNERKIFNYEEI